MEVSSSPDPDQLATIQDLPDEVLEFIFLIHTIPHGQLGPRSFNISYALVASWVCHRWRRVALGFPLLWKYCVSLAPNHWNPEFLVRSDPCLLDFNIYHECSLKALQAISSQRKRIRSLTGGWGPMSRSEVQALFEPGFPALEVLHITISHHAVFDSSTLAKLPNLKDLTCLQPFSPFKQQPTFLQGLTRLNTGGQPTQPLSTIDCLSALSQMRNLEYLRMCYSTTRANIDPVSLPNIALPSVIHFDWVSTSFLAIEFLPHIEAPKLKKLQLSIMTEEDYIHEHLVALQSIVGDLIRHFPSNIVYHPRVEWTSGFSFSTFDTSDRDEAEAAIHLFQLFISGKDDFRADPTLPAAMGLMFLPILSHLLWQATQLTLRLSLSNKLIDKEKEFVQHLFHHVSNLQDLSIDRGNALPVLSFYIELKQKEFASDSGPHQRIPDIKTIEFPPFSDLRALYRLYPRLEELGSKIKGKSHQARKNMKATKLRRRMSME